MAEYNFNDINDAKKRVREMQSKVREKSGGEQSADILSLLSNLNSQKDRALLLAVLYLLSNEEADNELLLSLLTILL